MPDCAVEIFVHFDAALQQIMQSLAAGADGGDDRNTEHDAERIVIKLITLAHKLIVHIERNNRADVHIDYLGCQKKIPFKIRGIHHIDDDIRPFVENIAADIALFGGKCCQRIGARRSAIIK